MAMTVKRRRDTQTNRVFVHKVADIRGGVSVKTSELGGDYLPEGAVLSAPEGGVCHVVKVAKVTDTVGASGVKIKVAKGHNFKAGDYIMAAEGAKAYAITAIDSSAKDKDELTIGTSIGAVNAGAFIAEAAAEAASNTSALKYQPQSLAGTGKAFAEGENIDTDAWVIGVTKGHNLPAFVADKLKGIINI